MGDQIRRNPTDAGNVGDRVYNLARWLPLVWLAWGQPLQPLVEERKG